MINDVKRLWLPFLWIFVLFSCASPFEKHLSVGAKFPLTENQIFYSDDIIESVAVSGTWIAVYTSGVVTAIDIETRKTLWTINLTVQTEDPQAFVIVDDVLVATSANQVTLIDKLGQKKKLSWNRQMRMRGDSFELPPCIRILFTFIDFLIGDWRHIASLRIRNCGLCSWVEDLMTYSMMLIQILLT